LNHIQFSQQVNGVPAIPLLLSDADLAEILVMTLEWVRSHATDIPGFERLGAYYRFRRVAVEEWLGGLDRLLEVHEAADLMKVPRSWVYANADEIPGCIRLGRYVRFRPALLLNFLRGSEVA
jgi:hypothetical protein